MKLASFDIFDTTLIRKCGVPHNIFYLLANFLYPKDECKKNAFFIWRKNAENEAVIKLNNKNVTLSEIYSCFNSQNFSEYTVLELIGKEKQIESENLIANPIVKKLIEKKRAEEYTICFISDMYLDSSFLQDILYREKCIIEDEQIFVSCEYGARKSNGILYDKVKNSFNIEEWQHFGDNPVSDYKIPLKKKIKSTLIDTSYTNAEQLLLSNYKNHRFFLELSLLVGFQRSARMVCGNDSFSQIAADFVASAYIPYLLHILNKANELGISRLYFLSRDSYILMKIAESLKLNSCHIEFKYLFVSRKSLFLPSLYELNKYEFLESLGIKTLIGKSIQTVLNYLKTDSKELFEKFEIRFDYNYITTKDKEIDFFNKILYGAYRNEFKRRINEERKILLKYFEQEGLCDDVHYAMVDVGWLGTTRLMINRILHKKKFRSTLFFYFGIKNDCLPINFGIYYSFHNTEIATPLITTIIEQYYSLSPYSSTYSYIEDESGSVVPVFAYSKIEVDNRIIESNILLSKIIFSYINEPDFIDFSKALEIWGIDYLDIIINIKTKINFEPFSYAGDFYCPISNKSVSLIRKMTVFDLISYSLFGADITSFDEASIMYTLRSKVQFLNHTHHFFITIRKLIKKCKMAILCTNLSERLRNCLKIE